MVEKTRHDDHIVGRGRSGGTDGPRGSSIGGSKSCGTRPGAATSTGTASPRADTCTEPKDETAATNILREQLLELIDGHRAHVPFDAAVGLRANDFPRPKRRLRSEEVTAA